MTIDAEISAAVSAYGSSLSPDPRSPIRVGGETQGEDRGGLVVRSLSDPRDQGCLSPVYCLIRSQLELFAATAADVKDRNARGGVSHCVVEVGTVGLRCVHCAATLRGGHDESEGEGDKGAGKGGVQGQQRPRRRTLSPKGAVCYPASVRLVYQAARNWQRNHLPTCPSMPDDVRARYYELKSAKTKSGKDALMYWQDRLGGMGLVDAPNGGMRLRRGVFESEEEGDSDGGFMLPVSRDGGSSAEASRAMKPKAKVLTGSVMGGLAVDLSVNVSGQTYELPPVEDVDKPLDDAVKSALLALGTGAACETGQTNASFDQGCNSLMPVSGGKSTNHMATDGVVNSCLATTQPVGDSMKRPVEWTVSNEAGKTDAADRLEAFVSNGISDEGRIGNAVMERGDRHGSSRTDGMVNCSVRKSQSQSVRDIIDHHVKEGTDNNGAVQGTVDLASSLDGGIFGESCNATMQVPDGKIVGSVLSDIVGHPRKERICDNSGAHDNLDLGASLSNSFAYSVAGSSQQLSFGANRTSKSSETAETSEPVGVNHAASDQPISTSPLDRLPVEATLVSGSISEMRDKVLKRVELALEIVKVSGEILELPPVAGDEEEGGDEQLEQQLREDLHVLGTELYEIFSGRRPFDNRLDEGGDEKEGSDVGSPEDKGVGPLGTTTEELFPSDWSSLSRLAPALDAPRHRKKRGAIGNEGPKQRDFVPLSELGLPTALSDLVSGLLDTRRAEGSDGDSCKSAEEVQEDLRLMLDHPDRYLFDVDGGMWQQQLDFSPDTLYGRSDEISQLLEVYHRAILYPKKRSNNIVLISGYSGTGKSVLVRKVQTQYERMGACCVSGKFDAMRQMQPLSAIACALNDYCRLLAQDVNRKAQIREAVSVAMGNEGSVLAELIPNLVHILSPTALDRASSPVFVPEAQCRIFYLVRALLRSTCSQEHPVVLVLDDLQWADEASLDLMKALVLDVKLNALLLVGCYRFNEVGSDHILTTRLEQICRSSTTTITRICTGNLDRESISNLLSDMLHLLPRKTRPLAKVVLQKTGGNALFVVQLLVSLRDEGLLHFSLTNRRWEWNIESIQSRNIANNVVDLMTDKLLRLAPEVHEALRIAAAFGAQCQEDTLRIFDMDPHHMVSTVAALDVAVAEGLMAKVDGPAYRFSHDQIQSAAYMLIPESERRSFHLKIGRSLWQHASVEEMDTLLFIVVDQLHRGRGLISDQDERVRLAKLSLTAGQKAVGMSAFLCASAYLQSGIGLICEDDWEWHRQLCFDLHNLCAEMEFVLGKFDKAKVHLQEVIRRGKTIREMLRAYYTSVQASGSSGNTTDAFDTAIAVLGYLGESVPSIVSPLEVQEGMLKTEASLHNKKEEELRGLKAMTVFDKREAMRFYNLLFNYAFAERPEYFPIFACRMMQLSLAHGVCKESAFGFGAYGMLVVGLLGDTIRGYRYGKMALALLDRFKAKECLPRVFVAVYAFITDWTDPLQSSLPCLKRAINTGLQCGDNEYGLGSAQFYLGTSLASGKPLGPLMNEMNGYANQMLELNQNFVYKMNKPLRQFALNLLGRSADPVKLVGEAMDEGNFLEPAGEKGSSGFCGTVYFYQMWLEVLFGEYERAAETGEKNSNSYYAKVNMGRFSMIVNHTFYYGLSTLILARRQGRSKWEDKIKMTMVQMKKWAMSNPWNCQHKLELMNAEYAYLEGDTDAAVEAYDCAVASAAKHRFVHEEALALERAGIFYMENGDHALASKMFQRAHERYVQWEAHSKAAHVQHAFL